jgi:hypothetical protein
MCVRGTPTSASACAAQTRQQVPAGAPGESDARALMARLRLPARRFARLANQELHFRLCERASARRPARRLALRTRKAAATRHEKARPRRNASAPPLRLLGGRDAARGAHLAVAEGVGGAVAAADDVRVLQSSVGGGNQGVALLCAQEAVHQIHRRLSVHLPVCAGRRGARRASAQVKAAQTSAEGMRGGDSAAATRDGAQTRLATPRRDGCHARKRSRPPRMA